MPHTWWALEQWEQDCDRVGLAFYIAEAYRSQERQNALYAQGRGSVGSIVTWTMNSPHTARLAVDIEPVYRPKNIRTYYEEIEKLGTKYGIFRPKELVKLNDLRHFELSNVAPAPANPPLETRIKQMKRAVSRTKNEERKRMMERRIARMETLLKNNG